MTVTTRRRLHTLLTPIALVAGVAFGLIVFTLQTQTYVEISGFFEAIATLWTNAMRSVVIPLIIATLIVAVAAQGDSRQVGRVAARSFLVFIGLLLTGVLFVLLTAPAILSRVPRYDTALPFQTENAGTISANAADASKTSPPTFKTVIENWIPSNLIKAAASDAILPLVIFAILIGVASSKISRDQQQVFIATTRAFANAMRTLAEWIIRLLPLGVFGVAFSTTAKLGWSTLGVIGSWLLFVCLLTTVFILILYLIARFAGGVSTRAFARATFEAQATAIATRSSLVALPALLSGARRHLHTPEVVASLTLPLAVSSFKLNRAISSTCRLLFLAHIYGLSLSAGVIATFIVTSLVTSFASPGIPTSGAVETLPFYVAAGIPVEGVILLGSVDSIPDFFMTVLNVTGDMTAMTIVGRLSKINEVEGDPLPAEEAQQDVEGIQG